MMRAIRFAAILAIVSLGGVLAWDRFYVPPYTPEPLPELTLTALDGRASFDPSEIEGPYLLNVWGSWCSNCRMEHATLMALQAEGIAIYGINWRDETDPANAFLDELGDPYVAVMQDVGSISTTALNISGSPETLVVSSEGEIIQRWYGPITVDALRTRIYPALEG